MKTHWHRVRWMMVFLGVACLGLLPMELSCSSRKTLGAAEAYERGWSHAEKGEHHQAIADFTEAIRLDPNFGSAYNNRGNSYAKKGDHDKAIADYTEAIRLDSNDGLAFYRRGNSYDEKG